MVGDLYSQGHRILVECGITENGKGGSQIAVGWRLNGWWEDWGYWEQFTLNRRDAMNEACL